MGDRRQGVGTPRARVWAASLSLVAALALPVGFAGFLLQLIVDLIGILTGTDTSLEPKAHG